MEIDLDTWIISDTHLGHYNMVKLCGRPLNFNEKIMDNWYKNVQDEDKILHLGDLSIWFGPLRGMWLGMVSEFPGDKYLILGNHDVEGKEDYEWCGWTVVDPFTTEIDGLNILFSHEPQAPDENWDINIHGHVHNNAHHDDYEFDWSGPEYVNMSVEVRNYKPWRLRDILEKQLSNVLEDHFAR